MQQQPPRVGPRLTPVGCGGGGSVAVASALPSCLFRAGREYDALALRHRVPGDDVPAQNHVHKHKQKNKGLEVVFDPKGHK